MGRHKSLQAMCDATSEASRFWQRPLTRLETGWRWCKRILLWRGCQQLLRTASRSSSRCLTAPRESSGSLSLPKTKRHCPEERKGQSQQRATACCQSRTCGTSADGAEATPAVYLGHERCSAGLGRRQCTASTGIAETSFAESRASGSTLFRVVLPLAISLQVFGGPTNRIAGWR